MQTLLTLRAETLLELVNPALPFLQRTKTASTWIASGGGRAWEGVVG
jgi:hypothetical protein